MRLACRMMPYAGPGAAQVKGSWNAPYFPHDLAWCFQRGIALDRLFLFYLAQEKTCGRKQNKRAHQAHASLNLLRFGQGVWPGP